jgi:hypothetical protein
MKKGILTVIIVAAPFFINACASTFVASKDGKGYYLGNGSNAAHQMFCESGDLKKILAGTTFAQDMKDNLYRYNCGTERSNEKVRQINASMTPEQRKVLRQSFKNNGYDINIMRC